MNLSESERRQLSEMGEDLLRDDPRLARSLSASVGRRQSLHSVAWGLAMASLALEVGVALARQSLICAVAWLGAIISVSILLLTPSPSAQRGRPT